MELKKLPYLDLGNVASLEDAARFIFRENLLHLQNSFKLILAKDNGRPLMQARISTRRIRMAMTTFQSFLDSDKQKSFESEFKHFGRKMGRARDLDVLLFNMLIPQCPIVGYEDEYACLRQSIVQERELQFIKIRHRLQRKRFQKLMSHFEKWLMHPFSDAQANTLPSVQDFAYQAVMDARKELLKRSESLDWNNVEKLHKFRKYVKQYRYNIRFFGSLLNLEAVEEAYATIIPLQDYLGEVNDIHVGTKIVQEFLDISSTDEPAKLTTIGDPLLKYFTSRLDQKLKLSIESWPKVAEFEILKE